MSDEVKHMDLVARYVEGIASREEAQALEQVLRGDEKFRREFLRYLNVDAALGGAAGMLRAMSAEKVKASSQIRIVWLRRVSLASAAAMILLFGVLWFGSNRTKADAPFATLMATTNARWSDPNVELALSSGERIASALRLESGRAEFQMVDGARVVLDGPASVRFAERKVVFVNEGRVFCQCPTPESRLSVITPQTKVLDLGTEFSVDARADESTRVAVLSGKVQLVSPDAGVLNAGETVEVRHSTVVRLQPLSHEEIAKLTPTSVSSPAVFGAAMQNRLTDPGFENPLPSPLWRGSDDCLEHAVNLGRAGNAVRIHAKEHRFWPLVKQRVATGGISGKVIEASAWAMSLKADPLTQRQEAVLKIAFLDAEGREFACSARHFLHKGTAPGIYVQSQLAARAPSGTAGVEVQLILNSCGLGTGSVCFDDASLVIAADAAK